MIKRRGKDNRKMINQLINCALTFYDNYTVCVLFARHFNPLPEAFDEVDCVGEMNRDDRNRLLRCRSAIVDDLEVKVILDSLVETGVVCAEHCEMIDNEVRDEWCVSR